ncbi:MAG: DUF3014 domain-containing protein [Gammaproteobacteria bacterium]
MNDNKPLLITLLVVLVAIVALVSYFIVNSSTEPEPERVAQRIEIPKPPIEPEPEVVESVATEPVPEIVTAPVPEVPQEPAFVLPPLDDSDPLIRDGVVSLTRHEGINTWLASEQLLRKFVAFTDNVAHGQVAKAPVSFLAPEGSFLVTPVDEETYVIDPASYDRYNRFTELVVSIDARRAAEFYHLLQPLLAQAYGELGYGRRSFDDVVFEGIGRLLETPVLEGPVRLKRPVVMFEYEDEKLESLSAAQKQLMRMGPRNTRMLQTKLREVAIELRAILER